MGQLVGLLLGFLGPVLEKLLGRILIALGVGVVTATGVDLALNALKAQTISSFSGLPPVWVQLISLAKVDVAFSMLMGTVISAYAVRMVAGSVSKFVARAPS
jgi:hypothetical protein